MLSRVDAGLSSKVNAINFLSLFMDEISIWLTSQNSPFSPRLGGKGAKSKSSPIVGLLKGVKYVGGVVGGGVGSLLHATAYNGAGKRAMSMDKYTLFFIKKVFAKDIFLYFIKKTGKSRTTVQIKLKRLLTLCPKHGILIYAGKILIKGNVLWISYKNSK